MRRFYIFITFMKKTAITLTGTAIRGAGLGGKLGFPTANLDRRGYSRLKHKPKLGIYAGMAQILPQALSPLTKGATPTLVGAGVVYPAAIIIGPKDNKGHPKIEAHLLDFTGVLYGKRLTLTLRHYLRPFMSFRSERDLKIQIRKDLRFVRKAIASQNLPYQGEHSDFRVGGGVLLHKKLPVENGCNDEHHEHNDGFSHEMKLVLIR